MPQIKLTQLAECSGCGAKIGPEELSLILQKIPKNLDKKILVDGGSDDAGVIKINKNLALAQTVDFFPPIVDDPYYFGQIAAANALSDIYAMGGKPLSVLNLICFPSKLDLKILRKILNGGLKKIKEANAYLLGGHSIKDREPKYGLAVTGLIDPKRIILKSGAKIGDKIILTKPLGTGIVATAIKKGIVPKKLLNKALKLMTTLNKTASELMLKFPVNACTDITGFGLLGHCLEVAQKSKVLIKIESEKVPILPKIKELLESGFYPQGGLNNLAYLKGKIKENKISQDLYKILADPQTSGGLLIFLKEPFASSLIKILKAKQIKSALIGEAMPLNNNYFLEIL
ncbi:MAG: selenide, water dikinase SelD [Armatimonadetes bacterium]|nr:selenide, water dikinase SelD [Armatimonadota bacterium]